LADNHGCAREGVQAITAVIPTATPGGTARSAAPPSLFVADLITTAGISRWSR
jgi:hypothetical protein